MHCMSMFFEPIDHEMPSFSNISINRQAYKVDGTNGIKVHCKGNELKSVDYFDNHPKHGFLYLEFSDLIAQDSEIKNKLKLIKDSDLPENLNREIRKKYYKIIHQELVQKIKDSLYLTQEVMDNYITNIPEFVSEKGTYVIVIAPIEDEKKLLDETYP